MKVAVLKETAPGERRVALVPEMIGRLKDAGLDVLVESGAGEGAWFDDAAYAEADATIVTRQELVSAADIILTVTKPDASLAGGLRPGQTVIGMLNPLADPGLAAELAAQGVTAVSLDGIPRTLSKTQPMDALSSQANIAGYKGAVVSGYDVRPSSKTEVESLGATFIELTSVGSAAGEGGYARALTDDERQAQQAELIGHIARHDVVITTAQVPGRRPPLLLTEDAIKAMQAGSVVVDMGSGPLGGNVAGSVPGETIVTGNGVTVIGAANLAASMPTAASTAYARNITTLLLHMVADGALAIDPSDDIQAGVVITHDGSVIHPATAALLADQPAGGASQ